MCSGLGPICVEQKIGQWKKKNQIDLKWWQKNLYKETLIEEVYLSGKSVLQIQISMPKFFKTQL